MGIWSGVQYLIVIHNSIFNFYELLLNINSCNGVISYLFISESLYSLKQIWNFSSGTSYYLSVHQWAPSLAIVEFCIQLLYLIFNLLYKVSTQPLLRYIFIGSDYGTSTLNVLCTHHPDDTCLLIMSVHDALSCCSIFIWFIFSQYRWSATFKMLSKFTYRMNWAMNWYWPSWNFNHFSFLYGMLTLT